MSHEESCTVKNRPLCSLPLLDCKRRIQRRCCDSRNLGDSDCPLTLDERAERGKADPKGLSLIPLSRGELE